MPVVIKELLITATILDAARPPAASAAEGLTAAQLAALSPEQLQECVSQVLAVLREQAER